MSFLDDKTADLLILYIARYSVFATIFRHYTLRLSKKLKNVLQARALCANISMIMILLKGVKNYD